MCERDSAEAAAADLIMNAEHRSKLPMLQTGGEVRGHFSFINMGLVIFWAANDSPDHFMKQKTFTVTRMESLLTHSPA